MIVLCEEFEGGHDAVVVVEVDDPVVDAGRRRVAGFVGLVDLREREDWRMTRSDSFLVVVASQDASRSG